MATSDRPKGAFTDTSRQSKRLFLINVALVALSVMLLVTTDDRGWTYWLRLGLTLLWTILAVLYYRSWQILRRSDETSHGTRT